LVAKSDSLWKQVGHKKATVASTSVTMGDIYFLKSNQHVINEKLYAQRGRDFVLRQVVKGVMVERKKTSAICTHFPSTFTRQAYD